MDLARVVGTVVATVKNESLRGCKLLLVQPVRPNGDAIGVPLVALDAVGAGAGETVFYVTGKEASFAFLPDVVPADASIVGIVDSVYLRPPTESTHDSGGSRPAATTSRARERARAAGSRPGAGKRKTTKKKRATKKRATKKRAPKRTSGR